MYNKLKQIKIMNEQRFKVGSEEANDLITNINLFGLNYVIQNFQLLGFDHSSENSVTYQFENGLNIVHTGYSASSQDVLETKLINSYAEILLQW